MKKDKTDSIVDFDNLEDLPEELREKMKPKVNIFDFKKLEDLPEELRKKVGVKKRKFPEPRMITILKAAKIPLTSRECTIVYYRMFGEERQQGAIVCALGKLIRDNRIKRTKSGTVHKYSIQKRGNSLGYTYVVKKIKEVLKDGRELKANEVAEELNIPYQSVIHFLHMGEKENVFGRQPDKRWYLLTKEEKEDEDALSKVHTWSDII